MGLWRSEDKTTGWSTLPQLVQTMPHPHPTRSVPWSWSMSSPHLGRSWYTFPSIPWTGSFDWKSKLMVRPSIVGISPHSGHGFVGMMPYVRYWSAASR